MRFLDIGVDACALYQTMIKYPRIRLAELGLWFGWREERVRAALVELERLALVKPGWNGQDHAVLTDPQVALSALLDTQEAALDQHQQDVERSKSQVASMLAEYDQAQAEGSEFPVHRVLGLDAVQSLADGLADGCTAEMMSFSPGGLQEADRAEDRALLDRGIRVRRLYLQSVVNDRATLSYARWLAEEGGEVRITPSLPVRMSIYDRMVAIVAIDPRHSAEGIMVLRGTGVLAALCAFFDHAWSAAAELGSPSNRDGVGLTAQEREILRLLDDGNTDAVVARKLGLSVRTIRRMIAELADRLGARSRFQLGARAVDAGWMAGGTP